MRLIFHTSITPALLLLAGCATLDLMPALTSSAPAPAWREAGYAPAMEGAPEAALLYQAWRSASPMPMEGSAGRFAARTYPGGMEGECEVFRLDYLELRHEAHYRICGGRIEQSSRVACALPHKDSRFEVARDAVASSAWASGHPAAQRDGAYTLEALPIGMHDARGCRPVIERIRCDGLLADWRMRTVCAP